MHAPLNANESENAMTNIKLTATDRALGKTVESVAAEREAMIRKLIAADPATLSAGQKALRTRLAAEIGVTLVAPKAPALSPHDAAKQAWLTRRDNAESALRYRAMRLAESSAAFRDFIRLRDEAMAIYRANPDFRDFATVHVDLPTVDVIPSDPTVYADFAPVAPVAPVNDTASRRNRRAA